MTDLASQFYDLADADEALEMYHRNGWTDGLPVVLPRPDLVAAMIERCGRKPDELIGMYEARRRPITIEKLAINSVMAGCLPEHFPVVIAIGCLNSKRAAASARGVTRAM